MQCASKFTVLFLPSIYIFYHTGEVRKCMVMSLIKHLMWVLSAAQRKRKREKSHAVLTIVYFNQVWRWLLFWLEAASLKWQVHLSLWNDYHANGTIIDQYPLIKWGLTLFMYSFFSLSKKPLKAPSQETSAWRFFGIIIVVVSLCRAQSTDLLCDQSVPRWIGYGLLGEERWTRKKHEKVQVRVTIKALTSSPTFCGLRDRLGKHVPGVRPNAKKAGAFCVERGE